MFSEFPFFDYITTLRKPSVRQQQQQQQQQQQPYDPFRLSTSPSPPLLPTPLSTLPAPPQSLEPQRQHHDYLDYFDDGFQVTFQSRTRFFF